MIFREELDNISDIIYLVCFNFITEKILHYQKYLLIKHHLGKS